MRKHFLILLLFALLPFSGWALDLDGYVAEFYVDPSAVSPTAFTLTYNAGNQNLPTKTNVMLKKSGAATILDGVSSAITITFDGNITTAKNAGNYSYTITVEGKTGSVEGVFTIEKAKLTYTGKLKTGTSIVYGSPVPAFSHDVTGFLAPDTKDNVTVNGEVGYVTDYQVGSNVGTNAYTVTPDVSGLSAVNYDFIYVNGTFSVTKKPLAATMAGTVKSKEYTASDYKPTVTGHDFTLADGTLLKASDYGLKYYTDATTTTEASVNALKDVNTDAYYVEVAAATTGSNYSGSFRLPYYVTKKDVAVKTQNGSSTYGSAPTVPALLYDGFVDATAPSPLTGVTLAAKLSKDGVVIDAPDAKLDYVADGYDVVVVASNTSGVVPDDQVFKNYTIVPFNIGKYTVNKANLVVTLKNQTKKGGESHPLDAAEGVAINSTNKATYILSEATLKNGDLITTYPNVVKGEQTDTEGKEFAITADKTGFVVTRTTTSPLSVKTVTDNYNISVVDGTFTIQKGQFNVMINDKSIVYGDKKAKLDITITGGDDDDRTAAKAILEKALKISAVGKLIDDDDEIVNTGTLVSPVYVDVDYPNAGVYEIELGDYDLGELDYTVKAFKGTYTITKRPLKSINALAQTLALNDNVNDVALNKANIAFIQPTTSKYTISDTDMRNLYKDLEFKAATTGIKKDEADVAASDLFSGDAIKSTAVLGTYTGAIDVVMTGATLKNFKFVDPTDWMVPGTLTVIANALADIVLDRAYTDDPVTTTDVETFYKNKIQAYKDKKGNVKFRNERILAAQKWYSMILPFEISVAKLSQTLGYALVNVLNPSSTDDNIKFQIEMGTIPANTPFLLKTAEEVDLNDNTKVVFTNVIIKDGGEIVEKTIGTSSKFIGIYNTSVMKSTDKFAYANEWVNGNNQTDASKQVKLAPMASYLSLSSASARIFIEDLDENGATAIKELNMDTMKAYNVDGWYTLNGVKLQGMPTEKGIYINNGKKVVIK